MQEEEKAGRRRENKVGNMRLCSVQTEPEIIL